MADNKNILNDFKEVLKAGNASDNDVDQFIQLMQLPDEQFDAFYPTMKKGIDEIYDNPVFEQEMLNNLKVEIARDPNFNIEEQASAARDFIKSIDEEELSNNKKEFLKKAIEGTVLKFIELYENPREKIKVKIEKLDPNASIPEYAHPLDAGADIKALELTSFEPYETKLVRTGLKIAIPKGYEISFRPRSGLSLKTGLRIANAPATIDSNYRGELQVIVENTWNSKMTIMPGDKIAQMIISPSPMIVWEEGTINDETDRGEGGFGSSDA